MKTISSAFFAIIFFATLLAAPSETVKAQTADKIDYYLDIGAGIPAAPTNFSQNWNAGYGIGAGISYEIQPSVKLQLYGQYYRFGFDEDGARDNVSIPQTITGIDGVNADLYHLMLNVIYEFDLPDIPTSTYFSVGTGYFRAVRNDFTVTTSDETIIINQNSGSSLGVNGAVGLRHALNNNLSIYAEAKFVTGLFVDRRTQYVPISLGINF